MSQPPPPDDILEALLSPDTTVTSRLDLYYPDGTIYYRDAPFTAGSVSVDSTRAERRTVELDINNSDRIFRHTPGDFWYDKIIRAYRGVRTSTNSWEVGVGTFMIDEITTTHLPHTIHVTGRDFTKKLLNSKFRYSTTFASGSSLESVIRAMAVSGGVTDMILPVTGNNLGADHTFESNTERFTSMNDLATSFGYEVFFDVNGYLIMREFLDPSTSPSVFDFSTGEAGSLVSYSKTTNDSRIYNVIVVTGDNNNSLPVVGVAENNEPTSPTNVDTLGERTYFYNSSFITTTEQAVDTANKFLKVHALEEYNLSLSSIVLPWLDAAEVVGFIDPDPTEGDPTRFLLSSFEVPLTVGSMSATAKRVTIVG